MFETLYTPTAIRELRRIPTNVARRIMERIERIAANPAAADNNVSKLKGRSAMRLRVGDWRVLFTIDETARVLTVLCQNSLIQTNDPYFEMALRASSA